MITYNDTLTVDSYVLISSDEEYILQNKGGYIIVLVAKSNGETPTIDEDGIEIKPGEGINSNLLNGVIWAKAKGGDTKIVYAK